MALTFLHLKCNNHMFDLRLKIKGSSCTAGVSLYKTNLYFLIEGVCL